MLVLATWCYVYSPLIAIVLPLCCFCTVAVRPVWKLIFCWSCEKRGARSPGTVWSLTFGLGKTSDGRGVLLSLRDTLVWGLTFLIKKRLPLSIAVFLNKGWASANCQGVCGGLFHCLLFTADWRTILSISFDTFSIIIVLLQVSYQYWLGH